ncbi:MAG: hypothetical protein P4M09_02450 [Devosia sp.]|jgi:hypothetical protein|nr:hypothetical protein [Devosia sp.]
MTLAGLRLPGIEQLERLRGARRELLVVGPHSEHLHDPGVIEHLIDQAVLNADAPRICAG